MTNTLIINRETRMDISINAYAAFNSPPSFMFQVEPIGMLMWTLVGWVYYYDTLTA